MHELSQMVNEGKTRFEAAAPLLTATVPPNTCPEVPVAETLRRVDVVTGCPWEMTVLVGQTLPDVQKGISVMIGT